MKLKTDVRWLVPLALLAALAMAACKGGNGGPLEPEEALLRMVLAAEDIGEPYVEDSAVTTTNEDLALGDEERLAELEDQGRILGYSVAMARDQADEVEFPVFGVESAASLYEGAGGAGDSFAEDVQEARDADWADILGFGEDTEIQEIDRSFADETFWLRVSAVVLLGENQTPVLVIDDQIILRQGEARGFLHISSAIDGSDDREALMDQAAELAELQASRMRDNLD
ncbi:MAG: hypothetical protein WD379_06850 [Dehalococcoidia bacterium]